MLFVLSPPIKHEKHEKQRAVFLMRRSPQFTGVGLRFWWAIANTALVRWVLKTLVEDGKLESGAI